MVVAWDISDMSLPWCRHWKCMHKILKSLDTQYLTYLTYSCNKHLAVSLLTEYTLTQHQHQHTQDHPPTLDVKSFTGKKRLTENPNKFIPLPPFWWVSLWVNGCRTVLNPWLCGTMEMQSWLWTVKQGYPYFYIPLNSQWILWGRYFPRSPQKSERCTARLGFGPFAVVIREEEENLNVKRNQNGPFLTS